MASIIRSLGNPLIQSLLLRSAKSSRLLPIASPLVAKLSYSTAPANPQSEVLPDITRLLVQEIGEMRKETQVANGRTQAANEKTQTLLEERAELWKNVADLKHTARGILRQKLQLERNLNVRGALEWITNNAVMEKKITPPNPDGIQHRLDTIAQLSDFEQVLNSTATKENLVPHEIKRCIGKLYHELSKHVHGNRQPIVVDPKEYTPAELAAIKIFLQVQSNWPNRLAWHVQTQEDEDKDYLILDF